MKLLFYRLTSPWRYLAIRDATGLQRRLNWTIPLLSAFAATAACWILDVCFANFRSIAVLRCLASCNSQLFFFPGFFLASLAAIAVFEKTSLDAPMPGGALLVEIRGVDGRKGDRTPSRRLFLCLLFSFLTVHSLFFCMALFLLSWIDCVRPDFILRMPPPALRIGSAAVLFATLFFMMQIFLNMLWGLYYLGERLPARCDP